MKYIKRINKKETIKKRFIHPIVLLLLGAFVVRFSLSVFGTLNLDQNTFIAWGNRALTFGFRGFYDVWSDYLPGYIYVLAFLARLDTLALVSTSILYKLPAILADVAVGYAIYYALRDRRKLAITASALFLLNPAVLANSTFWGQVDILTSLSTVGSIITLSYWPISAIFLALGIMVKPQALAAVPVIIALMINRKWGMTKSVYYGIFVLAVMLILFVPFDNTGNLTGFIRERFFASLDQYPYTSVNAFNFWGLWGFWKEDSLGLINPKLIGMLALGIVGLIAVYKYKFTAQKPYHVLAILLLTNFLFFTRMHERHMLPALAPLAIAAGMTPNLWFVYAGLSISYVLNLLYSYNWITKDFSQLFPDILVKLVILVNLSLFVLLVRQSVKPTKALLIKLKGFLRSFHGEEKISDRLTSKWEKRLLIVIILFSLFTRLYRLDFPPTDYFDEIYHAFTARQMLAGSPLPWDWSSPQPKGFAYEWTHPPLAKEIMAGSMGIFGVSPLAWRLPGALLGVLVVFGVYLVAKKLLKSRDIAVLAAFFMSMDGLLFTMSRIGTADIYFVAAAVMSYYFFLAKRDFWSALFLGFAAASKWSTIWFLPIFALTWVILRRRITPGLLWFFVIPPIVYLASYLPMFYFGRGFTTFWGMQKQMWWYHSGLVATHPYASPWWQWPLMIRPVYLYQNYKDGIVSNIYAIGNPFFFWMGLVALGISIISFIRRRRLIVFLLVFSYLVLFVPWALSPRIMFLYHYLPSLPFLAIILAMVLKKMNWIVAPSIVILIAFIYFYPHWNGIFVPEWLDKTYYWLRTWR